MGRCDLKFSSFISHFLACASSTANVFQLSCSMRDSSSRGRSKSVSRVHVFYIIVRQLRMCSDNFPVFPALPFRSVHGVVWRRVQPAVVRGLGSAKLANFANF